MSSGNSGSELDLVNQRKRKRMESNRESARRSRLRKQKHLDDLTAEVAELQKENGEVLRSVGLTTASYVRVEAENSVLRAQMAELTQSLGYLHGVLSSVNNGGHFGGACTFESEQFPCEWWAVGGGGGQQFPITATAPMMFDY